MTAAVGLALVGVLAMRMTPGTTTHPRCPGDGIDGGVFPTVSADSFGDVAGGVEWR